MRKREIIVLQGPPACGKSTYARELHKQNQNYVIVSRDNIRNRLNDGRYSALLPMGVPRR